MAMNKTQSWFADKNQLSAGAKNPIYAGNIQGNGIINPDGSTSTMDANRLRAARAAVNGKVGASSPIRLGVGEIMPETAGRASAPNFTMRGSVPAGQQLVPTYGFDPEMRGKTSPLPGPGLGARLKAGYQSAVAGPTIGELGGASLSRAKDVLTSKPVMLAGRAARFGARGVPLLAGAADAAGMVDVATDDKMGTSDVVEQGGRLAGRWGAAGAGAGFGAKLGAAAGALTGPAAPVAVPALSLIGGLAGGATGYMGAEKLMDAGAEQTAPDVRSNGIVKKTLGLGDAAKASVLPAAQPTQETVTPAQEVATPAAYGPSPWVRAATLEDEAKRQIKNAAPIQDGGNGLLARAEAGLSRARGMYAQGGEGGSKAFRDPAVQSAFNARNMLEGTGISVNTTKDGRTEFSGDNRAGGGQLYRAADGSMTTDWSKTQQYADAMQRNAKDQDRLVELTRGAALAGDREALARLTRGDSRLEGIAKQAGTEKRLRDAAGNGSVNAMHLLSEMEKTKSDGAYKAADLGLRGAALVGAQEDRNLNRQLREDQMRIGLANAKYTREKDARDTETEAEKRTNSMVKDISVTDGKFNPDLYQQNLTAASRLKRGRGEGDASYNTDVMETANLQRSLGDSQWLIDRMTSPPQGAQPDIWRVNKGLRGGYVTDDGKHIANWQLDRMPPEMKRRFLNDFVAKD